MDGFQGYVESEMLVGCGIPEVHLHGTEADWRQVAERLVGLAPFGLEA